MLKPARKQVAIVNDVYLCLYGTGFIILITTWPRRHAAPLNVQTKYAVMFIICAKRISILCMSNPMSSLKGKVRAIVEPMT